LSSAYFQRGRLQAELGSTEQALADFSQAIELAPAEVEAYLDRAHLYLLAGQAQEAFADLDQALALEPDNARAYLYRGMARRGLGEAEPAVADFSAAIELDSELAEAYANRGLAYQALGEAEKALVDYQQALRLGLHPYLRNQVEALVDALSGGQPLATTGPEAATPTAIPAPPSGSTLEAQLDQPFKLKLGQTAHLAEARLSLTFNDVLEDSRCPSQVNCAWAGQAIIALAAEQEGSAPGEFELNDNPPLKQDRLFYGGYLIQFVALDPYPEHPDKPILPEEYEVTLLVSGQ
jgi:tetratricopeptide (TPR) repeat protein